MNNQMEQGMMNNYSLEADMVTGWKPKLKIIGPMPLNYDNPSIDQSITALLYQESAFYQVCFLGPRPISSFKMQQLIAKNYRYKYAYLLHNDFAHLKPFFTKFYSLFQPQVKRPFCGMNPNIGKHELIFDSCFEGGNLDCAVRLKVNEYDLLLRVDSNTVGHVQWFYFKVTNTESTQKTIRFNLANLRYICDPIPGNETFCQKARSRLAPIGRKHPNNSLTTQISQAKPIDSNVVESTFLKLLQKNEFLNQL